MRADLAPFHGQRRHYRATFKREGIKSAYKGPPLPTVLLVDVVDIQTGKKVTDHLWFSRTKGFADLGLQGGEVVTFEARVGTYLKGHARDEQIVDYRLTRPTKIARADANARAHAGAAATLRAPARSSAPGQGSLFDAPGDDVARRATSSK